MKYLDQLRSDPRVDSIGDERDGETGPNTDGIWVYLKKGWCNGEDCHLGHREANCVHVVHEWNVTDVRKAMRGVKGCDCTGCKPAPAAPDFRFENHGSIWLLVPKGKAQRDHLHANVSDDALWSGDALVVEPRYVHCLATGLRDNGWSVS